MRSLGIAVALAGLLWLGLPGTAFAQESEPPPPPPPPQVRERAVPRIEPAPDRPASSGESAAPNRRAPQEAARESAPVRDTQPR